MDVRSTIIEAAAQLLAESATGDISTRAVCEAAGVQQPVLYRHFGDKDTLLAAVVDYGFEKYLAGKRAAIKSQDPVDDLRAGWDNHTAFALAFPSYYRLMFSPSLRTAPRATQEMFRLLLEVLQRVAQQGRLRQPAETAAQLIMAANTGVALSLVTRPELFPSGELSALTRDAILGSILDGPPDAAGSSNALTTAATTLLAGTQKLTPDTLTPAEAGLFREWLDRISH